MIPTRCDKDDRKWVKSQIMRLPASLRKSASSAYDDVHKSTYDATAGHDLIKYQTARTEANTRLRGYVDRVSKKLSDQQTRLKQMC